MSRTRDYDPGWENHVWVNQEKIEDVVTKKWHNINLLYFAGKYDISDKLSKDDLHKFLWAAYNYCLSVSYDEAGVEIGSRLRNEYCLTITKYKTSYAGLCRSFGPAVKNGNYEIYISYRYYEDWGNVQILETLFHEIGHLTYWNHDDEFWQEGERIGYGLEPKGVKGRAAQYRQYCGNPNCQYERFSVSRPNKWWVCYECYPNWQGAPEPNIDTWLALPSEEKVWLKVERYKGPEILIP